MSYSFVVFIQNNEFLVSRMEQITEGGSGRDFIFSTIFDGWLNSASLFNMIFGYGFASSLRFVGNYAHNDWLELLSNFGLIGVIIYSFLFWHVLVFVRDKRRELDHRIIMFCVCLIWFLITLFSMGYTNVTNGYLRSMLLAYLIGNSNRRLF